MSRRRHPVRSLGVFLSLLSTLVLASGCGFSQTGEGVLGWFDPYHDSMKDVNFEFTHNPLPMYPTMIGNVIGIILFLPATAITGAFGHPHDDPHSYFEYSASASAYIGGGLVGGPFVVLNLIFVRWWYDWAFPPQPGDRPPSGGGS